MNSVRFLYLVSLSVSISLGVSCTHVSSNSERHELCVKVFRSDTHEPISGVDTIVINGSGQQINIGKTDYNGHIWISKSLIGGSVAILFCRDGFFCGAFSLDRTGLMDYDEINIDIAPFYT